MAWAAQPLPMATVLVAENPPAATRVGMWLMESIRSTWRPLARLMQAWKSGSRTLPSRLAQSARVGLLLKSKGISFSTAGSRLQAEAAIGAQAT